MPETRYEIVIEISDPFGPNLAAWFEDCEIRALPDGATRLTAVAADRSAMHGLIERIRDLNLRPVHIRVDQISD